MSYVPVSRVQPGDLIIARDVMGSFGQAMGGALFSVFDSAPRSAQTRLIARLRPGPMGLLMIVVATGAPGFQCNLMAVTATGVVGWFRTDDSSGEVRFDVIKKAQRR